MFRRSHRPSTALAVCMWLLRLTRTLSFHGGATGPRAAERHRTLVAAAAMGPSDSPGRLLVLGGTGFLGQEVCRQALAWGLRVTSLSRRGLPSAGAGGTALAAVDYRQGDARDAGTVRAVLAEEGGYTAALHCIGLLFDDASGLGGYNRLVSGSGSVPDAGATYDAITRQTAENAIDAAREYAQRHNIVNFPFLFMSAAEAGWPNVALGPQVEAYLAPDWLRRYLTAKRRVEARLLAAQPELRPVIFRPSLIYSLDRPASYLPVGAFFLGNRLGLPFVDRPVAVADLAAAVVRAATDVSVRGVQRYPEIDALSRSLQQ